MSLLLSLLLASIGSYFIAQDNQAANLGSDTVERAIAISDGATRSFPLGQVPYPNFTVSQQSGEKNIEGWPGEYFSLEYIKNSQAILGSKDAPVAIVEYGEYQCPFCGYWARNVKEEIIQKLVDTGKAKLVWKDFTYYGPDSVYASEAAYAAAEQGKYWAFHNYLFSKQGFPNSGWTDKENLNRYAQEIGLDLEKFNRVLEVRKYLPLIEASFNEGKEVGVTATPTFFVVGPDGRAIRIVGPQPYSVFKLAVEAVLDVERVNE